MRVQAVGHEDPLEEEMATHCNILAWKVPWTEEPGGLRSMCKLACIHVNSSLGPWWVWCALSIRRTIQALGIRECWESQ